MQDSEESDHLFKQYRDKTSGPAPKELQEGVLKRLNTSVPAYPFLFALTAIICAAGFASAFSFLITNSQIKHPPASPPRFLQQETPNSFFNLR